MAELVIMPKLGFNMNEGKLVKWHKKEGDQIKKGEAFFSIETDKTNIDIEATGDGIVCKQFINEGDSVKVTLPIAIVAKANEDISTLLNTAKKILKGEGKDEQTAGEIENEAEHTSKSSSTDYEVIVIGGGPGGYVAAVKAAQMGKKTCIIEKNKLGGTCLNVGCIPTKTMLRSLEVLNEVRNSEIYGIVNLDLGKVTLDLEKVQQRKEKIVGQLVDGIMGLLMANGVEIIQGKASFIDKKTIRIEDRTITGEHIIIASGSSSKHLQIPINGNANVMTSTELLNIQKVPESIAVIGGGVIGVEFAYFLASIGTKVFIVEFLDRILPMVDEEITHQVTQKLMSMGIEIYTGSRVTEINDDHVFFDKDGEMKQIKAEQVLISVGRTPDIKGLNLEAIGVKVEKGSIVTNEYLQTNIEGIYAVGDVNGKVMLAHKASMEGVIAVENICGNKVKMDYTAVPSVIYIKPEIASVGLTEEQARKKYKDIKIGKFPLLANGKAKVLGEENGFIKIVVEPRLGEILGVHMYCSHATDMIAEAVAAMKLEATADEMAMVIHPHPTLSESIHEAFHAAVDKAIHFISHIPLNLNWKSWN